MLKNIFFNEKMARVAINMKKVKGPWGGSAVFVSQMEDCLKLRGYDVVYHLKKPVDVIILMDPREELGFKSFGMNEIIEHKKRNPNVRMLHRVNECDQRKATTFMDPLLERANKIADYTVFISEWVRDYHAQRWFDKKRPHKAIYNGADPNVFHPIGKRAFDPEGPFRIVTHHWSDNPLKGYGLYQEVDRMIAGGELPGVEFWVIGRWPSDIRWRAARTFPPTSGSDMADKLRSCHAYITASVWEPCGMHHVEGAQCGLPLIYHEDGGGIVEAGGKYGVGFKDDVKSAILRMRREYQTYQERLLQNMPSGDRMCMDYTDIIQRLICERDAHIQH